MSVVDILLSTYNGQEWIDEQIRSIFAQDYPDWRLLIRDDGSTDQTVEKLLAWKKRFPDRISLYLEENIGIVGSFNRLLSLSEAHYIAFADQDDSFKPDKLSKLMSLMESDQPLLIHHDLEVVDATLKQLHPSFWAKMRLNLSPNLSRLLVQNSVTGCACLFNRALLNIAAPIPQEAAMHDHWIALSAAAFGKIRALQEPLTLYRQHGRNQIGAQSPYSFKRLFNYKKSLRRMELQAAQFLRRYESSLSQSQQSTLKALLTLPHVGPLARARLILKERLYKSGFLRNILFALLPR